MSYSPYYPNGWQTGESGGTPITPAALNHIDDGISANEAAIEARAEDIADINTLLGNTSMGTTATTVTGAIKEHSNKIGNTAMGTTATTLTGAIKEHETDITTLNSKLTSYETTSNTVSGLTLRLYYQKSCPNIMCLKITGTTSGALATSSGYVNLWNVNSFLTAAVGTRSASLIKYIIWGTYRIQLYIETGGLIKVGYSTALATGSATDIPASENTYIEEMIFLK